MKRQSVVAVILVMLVACASNQPRESPAYEQIKPGSKLRLTLDLTIPANLARVYFQDGRVISRSAVDQYRPSCSLLSYVLSDDVQEVVADDFRVVRVYHGSEFVQAAPILLAANQHLGVDLFNTENGPMAEIMQTSIVLQSGKNPDIKRLECESWEKPVFARHLSLAEVRQALGTVIEINP